MDLTQWNKSDKIMLLCSYKNKRGGGVGGGGLSGLQSIEHEWPKSTHTAPGNPPVPKKKKKKKKFKV